MKTAAIYHPTELMVDCHSPEQSLSVGVMLDKWLRWPQGDAGDAIDFACDHAKEPLFFLEDWREGCADQWPEYMRWLKVQRDGALEASSRPPLEDNSNG